MTKRLAGPRLGTWREPREYIRGRSVVDDNGCWIWQQSRDRRGYGQAYVAQRQRYAHRLAYEIFVGPIPEGMELDHLCSKTSCCNPAHLEPVTPAENQRRWFATVTTCHRGHPWTPETTIQHRNANRRCRICHRATRKEWEHRRDARRLVS